MLVWLTLPFYDFCGFQSIAVNSAAQPCVQHMNCTIEMTECFINSCTDEHRAWVTITTSGLKWGMVVWLSLSTEIGFARHNVLPHVDWPMWLNTQTDTQTTLHVTSVAVSRILCTLYKRCGLIIVRGKLIIKICHLVCELNTGLWCNGFPGGRNGFGFTWQPH